MDNEKEISFGAFDSELMHQEIYIPEGFEATIDGDKIILKKIESEDEKIRKSLIILLQHFCKGYRVPGLEFPISYKDMLAWLEKQGEHKKFRDSIQVGDEVTRNSDGVIVNLSQLKRVAKKDEKQGEQKPIDKIQLGKKYKCIASPRYSTFRRGNIYKPVDNFLCNLMNLCYECFEPIEDSEQKPADKVEPKFKVGDWVVYCGKTCKITGLHNGIFTITNQDGSYFFNQVESTMEPIFHLWTIQDAKNGDVLVASDDSLFIFARVKDNAAYYHYSLCKNGSQEISDGKHSWEVAKSCHPATKEQRDLLFQKMREAGYEWDSEKKELKKIELSDVGHEYYSELLKNDTSDNIADYAYQCVYCMSHDWAIENPTWDNVQSACRLGAKWQKKHDVSEGWSEEDEAVINKVESWLDTLCDYLKDSSSECIPDIKDVINKLNSLRYQKQWKPSDAQIRALEYIIDNAHNTSYSCKIAKELLEQLRKLKGE